MFRLLLVALALFALYRFLWGMRQGYKGRTIEHPIARPSRRTYSVSDSSPDSSPHSISGESTPESTPARPTDNCE